MKSIVNFMESMVIRGNSGYYIWRSAKFEKHYGTLNISKHKTIYGWKSENATDILVFIRSHPNCINTLLNMGNTGYHFSWQSPNV